MPGLIFILVLIGFMFIYAKIDTWKSAQQPRDNTSIQKNQSTKQENTESRATISEKAFSSQGRKRAIKHGLRVSIQPGERYTIEDMLKQFDCFDSETTPQEIRDCLTDLGEYGTKEVVQEEIEGKTYYSFPSGSTPTHLTPVQEANEILKRRILDDMESGKRYTIGDMLANFDCFEPNTGPQKVSALLSQLGARGTGEIVRTEEKGKAYFSLADKSQSRKQTSPPTTKQYSSGSPSTNTPRYSPPTYTKSSPSYSSPSYAPYPSGNRSSSDDEYDDPVHYNFFQNGPTDHGTFVGNCKNCGVVWEFENYEVIPVPYPHGTCPNCHQWVAVF